MAFHPKSWATWDTEFTVLLVSQSSSPLSFLPTLLIDRSPRPLSFDLLPFRLRPIWIEIKVKIVSHGVYPRLTPNGDVGQEKVYEYALVER